MKFHHSKINDPLLDVAVSYSDHPLTRAGFSDVGLITIHHNK